VKRVQEEKYSMPTTRLEESMTMHQKRQVSLEIQAKVNEELYKQGTSMHNQFIAMQAQL